MSQSPDAQPRERGMHDHGESERSAAAPYDQFAAAYAADTEANAFNALYERPAMLALLGDVGGKRVLDAGCGASAGSRAPCASGSSTRSGCAPGTRSGPPWSARSGWT